MKQHKPPKKKHSSMTCASCEIRRRLNRKIIPEEVVKSRVAEEFLLTRDHDGLVKTLAQLKNCKKCKNDKMTLFRGRVVDCESGSPAMRRAAKLPAYSAGAQSQYELSCVLQVLGELAGSEVKTLDRLHAVHQQLLDAEHALHEVTSERDLKEKQFQHLETNVKDKIEQLKRRLDNAELDNKKLAVMASRGERSESELSELQRTHKEVMTQLQKAIEKNEKMKNRLSTFLSTESMLAQANQQIKELEARVSDETIERKHAEEREREANIRLEKCEAERVAAIATSCEMTRLHADAVQREQILARQITRDIEQSAFSLPLPKTPEASASGHAGNAANSVERIIAESVKIRHEFEEQAQSLRGKYGVLRQGIAPISR